MKKSSKIILTATHHPRGRRQCEYGSFIVENIPRRKNLADTMRALSIYLGTLAIRHSGNLCRDVEQTGSISLWQYADVTLTGKTASGLTRKLCSIFNIEVELRWERAEEKREAA